MSTRPKISILLPVYNGEKYLSESIESVLNQTYKDFELIIINDGSTDGTSRILNQVGDPRVKIVSLDKNQGIIKALNIGLSNVRGDYIARLDADDRALPQRLEIQIETFFKDTSLVLLGTAADVVDDKGVFQFKLTPPENDYQIRWAMLFHNSFIHSSVMLKAETIRKHSLVYRQSALHAEDFELWSQVIRYGKCMNLSGSLVKYRLHPSQIRETFATQQLSTADRIAYENLREIVNDFPENAVSDMRRFYNALPRDLSPHQIETLFNLFIKAMKQYCLSNDLTKKELQDLKRSWYWRTLMKNSQLPLSRLFRSGFIFSLFSEDAVYTLYILFQRARMATFGQAGSGRSCG